MAPQENRPSAGDMTGRLKADLAKKAQLDQQEKAAEMSMATAAQDEVERTAVFDAQSGAVVAEPGRTAFAAEPEAQAFPVEPQAGFFRDEEPALTGRESDEEINTILAARAAAPPAPRPTRALSPTVRVRIDQDVEKMTYGMRDGEPNNFNFKEGLQYDVPREVAEHLDERGLVRQWVTH